MNKKFAKPTSIGIKHHAAVRTLSLSIEQIAQKYVLTMWYVLKENHGALKLVHAKQYQIN